MWCPLGSCLGLPLFTIYTQDLFSILGSRFPTSRAYADNTQLCLSFSPNVSTREADDVTAIENCIQDITQMMCEKSYNHVVKLSIDGVRVGDYTYVLCHQSVIWACG